MNWGVIKSTRMLMRIMLLEHSAMHRCQFHISSAYGLPRRSRSAAPLGIEKTREITTRTENKIKATEFAEKVIQSIDVSGLKPALPVKSQSLAPYVNESVTLSNLVKIGIDLSKAEKDPDLANHLVRADFEKDIKPYLLFLHDIGVEDENIGSVLSNHPALLTIHLDDLHARVNYLRSKKFKGNAISSIVSKRPSFLSVSTVELDTQLGFLQRQFSLSGDEVRSVIIRYPRLIFRGRQRIEELVLVMTGFMGFSHEDMKQMLLRFPKLYMSERYGVGKRVDYILNEMGLPLTDIVYWPNILRTKMDKIKARHSFLRHLERDQFDSQKPNYISLKALASGNDQEFCEDVAKMQIQSYNDFLKTL